MSSSPQKTFIKNDNYEEVNAYVNEMCTQNSGFLCNNKELCGTSPQYGSAEAVQQICENMEKGKQCDTNFKECVVSVENLFDDTHVSVKTSFVNIILPIKDAFDDAGNQKFLRLPPLSGTPNPKSKDICNICKCMSRFSTSPGAGAVLNEKSNTGPGQNTCIYPDFIEHYYYPLSIENVTTKIPGTPPIKLGKYTIVNSNIIYAHSEEDLLVQNLYDLLIKNDIPERMTKSFITETLYQKDTDKSRQLELHINTKLKKRHGLRKKGLFYQNISFFYMILILFIVLLFLR